MVRRRRYLMAVPHCAQRRAGTGQRGPVRKARVPVLRPRLVDALAQ